MSNLTDFLHSRILRHPTTWIVAFTGAMYGGLQTYGIREAKRAAGAEIQFPWLWLERTVDFAVGASFQVFLLLCAVWIVAGMMEHASAWVRQLTVISIYLGIAFLSYYLYR